MNCGQGENLILSILELLAMIVTYSGTGKT